MWSFLGHLGRLYFLWILILAIGSLEASASEQTNGEDALVSGTGVGPSVTASALKHIMFTAEIDQEDIAHIRETVAGMDGQNNQIGLLIATQVQVAKMFFDTPATHEGEILSRLKRLGFDFKDDPQKSSFYSTKGEKDEISSFVFRIKNQPTFIGQEFMQAQNQEVQQSIMALADCLRYLERRHWRAQSPVFRFFMGTGAPYSSASGDTLETFSSPTKASAKSLYSMYAGLDLWVILLDMSLLDGDAWHFRFCMQSKRDVYLNLQQVFRHIFPDQPAACIGDEALNCILHTNGCPLPTKEFSYQPMLLPSTSSL